MEIGDGRAPRRLAESALQRSAARHPHRAFQRTGHTGRKSPAAGWASPLPAAGLPIPYGSPELLGNNTGTTAVSAPAGCRLVQGVCDEDRIRPLPSLDLGEFRWTNANGGETGSAPAARGLCCELPGHTRRGVTPSRVQPAVSKPAQSLSSGARGLFVLRSVPRVTSAPRVVGRSPRTLSSLHVEAHSKRRHGLLSHDAMLPRTLSAIHASTALIG